MEDRNYRKLIKCYGNLESELLDTKSHIRGLINYLKNGWYIDTLGQTNSWLWLASSIKNVDYDGVLYDSAFTFCEPAREYEKAKQELHSCLLNELTIFLYVYSALESLLNSLELQTCPKNKGKINAAKYFLKQKYSPFYITLPYYAQLVLLMRQLISKSSLNEYEKYFELDSCTDFNGIGLKVLYKIRNALAHGEYGIPEPMEWTTGYTLEPEITRLSIRLALISIQMLIISINDREWGSIELYDEIDYEYIVDELRYLQSLHYKTPEKIDKAQLKLF